MAGDHLEASAPRDELLRIIRSVRNRWRLRIAARGAVLLVAGLALVFFLSAYLLETYRFSETAVVAFRVLFYGAVVALIVGGIVLPLIRRVSDERVALYLEEHDPALEAALLSALDESGRPAEARTGDWSPALVERLIASAVERCERFEGLQSLERLALQRSGIALLAVAGLGALLLALGPAYLRHALMALLPLGSAQAASPYHIVVTPGDATVARGSDQIVTARLEGFESDEVDLYSRSSGEAPFDRVPLVPGTAPGTYEVMLFDLAASLEYFVQSAGVQSTLHRFEVVEQPFVDRLELQYVFPAYTGLAPRTIEDGGDIAVLRGTQVEVRIVPTMATPAGQLVRDGRPDALEPQADGTFAGRFTVDGEGFYRILLEDPRGTLVEASPEYTIDVLADMPPAVSIATPGRDTMASPVEEVFIEARADDDFGVATLELVYSVNGDPEQRQRLYRGGESGRQEVTAGHTLFLEELDLEPGDFITYHARALDTNPGEDAKAAQSDLYFVRIRPFGKDYRAAESQGGGGGGGGAGMGGDPRGLSAQQREIIAATFNVLRDRDQYDADEYREHLVFLALSQGRLREQVSELTGRLRSRVVQVDPAFEQIGELLPQALTEMQTAEQALQGLDADQALSPEQRALQLLQRAEEAYEEVRVQMGNNAGGGGGGGQAPQAEELADLFELELDKLDTQYETLQRAQQQAADTRVDETLERLRELAERQQQEVERQRRRASGQQSATAGGAGQRALADETEEAARRLERLAREESSPQMMAAARDLQEAADAMRRAAASPGEGGLSEASDAESRLRDVQGRLQDQQQSRLQRDIDDARRRADALAQQQEDVESQVGNLNPEREDRQSQIQTLHEQKDLMAGGVADLEQLLDRTSADFRREEPESARKLQEAADSIRDNKLRDKIRYSKGVVLGRPPEFAQEFETQIASDIQELRDRIAEASDAVGERGPGDLMAEALDETRELIRGMESLDDRLRNGGESQGEAGQQGQEGQQGQAGQEGQAGQQGQEGQAGQQGQGAQAESQGGEGGTGSPDGLGRDGDTIGSPNFNGGGWGSSRPGPYSTDEVRQFRREVRERSTDADELRRLLNEEGYDVEDLEAIIRAMRELDSQRVYADVAEIERLQTYVIEGLKRFEYQLRRSVDGAEEDQLLLSGNDEVPEGFRELVEEYYRALSREQPASR